MLCNWVRTFQTHPWCLPPGCWPTQTAVTWLELLAGLLAVMLAVSLSRTGALLRSYSAPMAVFRALPEARVLHFTVPVPGLLVSSH